MQTLDTPVSIDTPFGPVQATHIAHNYTVSEIGNKQIISTRQYAVLVGTELRPVGTASTIDLAGADRDALGADPTGATILAKHIAINTAREAEAAATLESRKTSLTREIAETEARLAALRAQAR